MPYKDRKDKNAHELRRYHANKHLMPPKTKKQIAANVAYNRIRVARRRRWINYWKLRKGCEICGYKEYSEALDFHHKDEKEKHVSVSATMTFNLKTIFKEIRKCILVCANCHRVLHRKARDAKETATR